MFEDAGSVPEPSLDDHDDDDDDQDDVCGLPCQQYQPQVPQPQPSTQCHKQ